MTNKDIVWPLFDFANFPGPDKSGLMSDAHNIIHEIMEQQPIFKRRDCLQCLHPNVIVSKLRQYDDQLCISINSTDMCMKHVLIVLNVWRSINGIARYPTQ
jgi:hypothetical protein